MDAQRRRQVATAGAAIRTEIEAAVTDSWADLLPAAESWTEASTARARAASTATLQGLLLAFEQGDLDDRRWSDLRATAFGHGHANADEVADLLRTVRIVGVELLADRLEALVGLTHDERWQLQREAAAFCEQLVGVGEDLDPAALDMMLAELERSGPDLA